MKTRQISNMLFGAILIGFAAYFGAVGKVPGRGGVTSMTRESHPVIFWGANLLIGFAGVLLVFYGVAKMFNFASGFTRGMDRIANRFSVLMGRRNQTNEKGDA